MSEPVELRPYQQKALDQIIQHYRKGEKRVLLHLATGGGKTVIFSRILKGVFEKGNRGTMLVRGRKLVDQAHRRLIREGVPHGVTMANHWNNRPHERIQICSIDTLRSRNIYPKSDIVVIDEAHLFTSKGDQDYLQKYQEPFMLPVTATPYGDQGLGHMADHVVHPVTVQELIDSGYLVPPRYFAPSVPDTSKVKVSSSTKDFNVRDLEKVMAQEAIVGNIIEHWQEIGENKPTLGFAVSIDHSKFLVERFKKNGIKALHCDANSSDQEREDAVARLKAGDISILFNVGIFCTGVDIPFLANIIMARPTKSYNLYIQQSGRGTRPDPETGKAHFKILDHAANVLNHGFIENEKEANLAPPNKTKKQRLVDVKICSVCFAAYKGQTCVVCGSQSSVHAKHREFIEVNGRLKEITAESYETKVRRFIDECKKTAKERGYKRGWVYYQVKDKFGDAVADRFMPKRKVPDWIINAQR